MKKTARLVTEEKNALFNAPILIVDKQGLLGDLLSQELEKDILVVFVSEKIPSPGNVVHIPFEKNIPTIPNNTYSYIFVVDDGRYTRESIPSFIKKAEQDKSGLAFITYLRYMDEKSIEYLSSEYKRTKVIIYGDIFGKNLPSFIQKIKESGKIEIPGDGTRELYPVFINDVVKEILKAVFGANTKLKIFYLFQRNTITYLLVAKILQKKYPELKIDFIREEKQKEINFSKKEEGEYLLGDDYPLEKRIEEVFDDESMQNRTEEDFITAPRKKYPKKIIFIFFLIIFFLLLPLLSTLVLSLLGAKTLIDTSAAFDNENIKNAEEKVNLSNLFFSGAVDASKVLVWQTELVGLNRQIEPFIKKIETGKKISYAASDITYASITFKNIISGNSANLTNDFDKLESYIKNSAILLSEAEVNKDVYPDIIKKIQKENELISVAMSIQDELPDILGVSNKKTYLVLFQNNMELRPGGGFIGSYALMTMDKGKMTDFSVHDVYDADGQLKGHVEPPYPIRRYLAKANWYLRDSNFDVDFTRSASSSAFFLNTETGKMVDGVIGADVSFVKNFLSTIGPVYVPQYNETVNADNLFYLTEQHAEKNFFPSSTQKKDFLSFLFKAIEGNLSSRKNLPYLAIAKAITESLTEKHIVLAFNNPSLQDISTVNRWSSSLWDDRKTSRNSINDFVGISEANLGVDKANYFLGRSVSYDAKVQDDGTVLSKITVSYKNASTGWPGGDYKNYLRFILPLDSELLNIFIDGTSQKIVNAITDPSVYEKKNFVPPDGLEVEKTEELGKTIYGFLVVIPSGALKTISLSYKLAQKISQDTPSFLYSLYVFKQPGTDNYPFDFTLSYPSSYQVISPFENFHYKNNKIFLSEDLTSDKEFFVNLAKK